MGLLDRIADLGAKLFSPTMDHPQRGGMTGEDAEQADSEDPVTDDGED